MLQERAPAEPPPGPPWDQPLGEAPLAFVDLELTGLRPERDRIIEVCVERVRGGVLEARVASLVRPEPMSFGNGEIHGIQIADLEGAPTFGALAPRIVEVLSGAIMVAHAADKDAAFLEAELARAGIAFQAPFHVDTLSLSRRAFAFKTHGLVALSKALGLAHDRPHRAASDVTAMRALFDRITAVLRPATPRDLWHVRVGERHARPDVLAAAAHAVEQGLPVTVRYRPSHRAPEDLAMRLLSVRTDLDPPRVLGYLLASRAHRELRADRILAILAPTAAANRA